MRNIYVFITLLFSFLLAWEKNYGQTTITLKATMPAGAIVKDSSGRIMNPEEWQPLAASGNYMRKKIEGTEQAYFLLKMTASQRDSVYKRVLGSSRITSGSADDVNKMVNGQATSARSADALSFVGKPFPDFSGTDVNGVKFDIRGLKGKVIVINAWFVNCAPCIKEIPELNKLAETYKNDGIVFLAINPVDLKDGIQDFLSKNAFNYRQVAQPDALLLAKLFSLNVFPTNIIVDKEGVVRYMASAFTDRTPGELRERIESLK